MFGLKYLNDWYDCKCLDSDKGMNDFSDPLGKGKCFFWQELCPPYNSYLKLHILWSWYKPLVIMSRERHRYLWKKENGCFRQNGLVTGISLCNDFPFTAPCALLIDYCIHWDFYCPIGGCCVTGSFKTNEKPIFQFFFSSFYLLTCF